MVKEMEEEKEEEMDLVHYNASLGYPRGFKCHIGVGFDLGSRVTFAARGFQNSFSLSSFFIIFFFLFFFISFFFSLFIFFILFSFYSFSSVSFSFSISFSLSSFSSFYFSFSSFSSITFPFSSFSSISFFLFSFSSVSFSLPLFSSSFLFVIPLHFLLLSPQFSQPHSKITFPFFSCFSSSSFFLSPKPKHMNENLP